MKRLLIFIVALATLALASCKKEYTITVKSNNEALGSVTGGGEYKKGTTATIGAIPAQGCIFQGWQDGNNDNPRSVEVTGDATYTANFVSDSYYADQFVGEYSVTTNATFNNIPIVGTYSMDFPTMTATIVKTGSGNEVEVTMAGQTRPGYANSTGLHVEPIVVNQTILTSTVAVTVTFPTISAPVNGTTSWTSTLSASFSGVGINGTAEMTATKK